MKNICCCFQIFEIYELPFATTFPCQTLNSPRRSRKKKREGARWWWVSSQSHVGQNLPQLLRSEWGSQAWRVWLGFVKKLNSWSRHVFAAPQRDATKEVRGQKFAFAIRPTHLPHSSEPPLHSLTLVPSLSSAVSLSVSLFYLSPLGNFFCVNFWWVDFIKRWPRIL